VSRQWGRRGLAWLRRWWEPPNPRRRLQEALSAARSAGVFDGDARAMLEGVLEMSRLTAGDVMVPRGLMTLVSKDASFAELLPSVVESGHSRFPVYAEDRDDIVGVLLAKELLRYFVEQREAESIEFDIREVLRPAVRVPAAKRLNVLLREFRENRYHMAIVVDEYGGVAGLITIEDVLEEIVGEIDDEFDTEDDQLIRRDKACEFTIHASTPITTFNEFFQATLSDATLHTVGGLLAQAFGRIPKRFESIKLGDFEFRVLRVSERRIETLKVLSPKDVVAPVSTP
jgi:magnesium and cobalt transporter